MSGIDTIDVNIKGTLYTAQAALPTMLEQSSGHLINIASISGFEVTKSSTIYSATKAAVHTITQGLEKSWQRQALSNKHFSRNGRYSHNCRIQSNRS